MVDKEHDRMVLSLIRRVFRHRRFNAHDCVAIQDFYDKYCMDLDTEKLDDAHFEEGALQAIVEIILVIEKRD